MQITINSWYHIECSSLIDFSISFIYKNFLFLHTITVNIYNYFWEDLQ